LALFVGAHLFVRGVFLGARETPMVFVGEPSRVNQIDGVVSVITSSFSTSDAKWIHDTGVSKTFVRYNGREPILNSNILGISR